MTDLTSETRLDKLYALKFRHLRIVNKGLYVFGKIDGEEGR